MSEAAGTSAGTGATVAVVGAAGAAAVALRAMRWWDVDAVVAIERDLHGAEAWSPELFWSELAAADTRAYLLAERAGELVGYAGLCVYPDLAYVQTLAVRRDAWGEGVGTGLLRALLAEADRRGRRSVALEVRADNDRAQRLYARHGFAEIGRRRGYYQPSGADALVLQRGPR